MIKFYLSSLLTIALVACATDAPKIDDASLSGVRKGQTTLVQVVGRFGRPTILSRNIDGTQTAAYVHSYGHSSTPAVVPLMAAMAGASNANVDSVIFSFDAAGVLTDYKQTRAHAPAPAVAPAPVTVEGSATVTDDKPAQAVKQTRSGSDPWTIRLEASGQRENR